MLWLTFVLSAPVLPAQNRDPLNVRFHTSDVLNFWEAFDQAGPGADPAVFQKLYIDRGSDGLKGFMRNRIVSAAHLAKVVTKARPYYESARESTLQVAAFETQMRESFVKFAALYPEARFPDVYFVIGALSSGGTTSKDVIIIGTEMYGRTTDSVLANLSPWLQTVIKPVDEIPVIVAHELIHVQQRYDGGSLLQASLKEGSADFLGQLISGRHINEHVHAWADPREQVLWIEFQRDMNKKEYTGWMYSGTPGRPNDLGYWMGYKISKAFYDNSADKTLAIKQIIQIKDASGFLKKSGYGSGF